VQAAAQPFKLFTYCSFFTKRSNVRLTHASASERVACTPSILRVCVCTCMCLSARAWMNECIVSSFGTIILKSAGYHATRHLINILPVTVLQNQYTWRIEIHLKSGKNKKSVSRICDFGHKNKFSCNGCSCLKPRERYFLVQTIPCDSTRCCEVICEFFRQGLSPAH